MAKQLCICCGRGLSGGRTREHVIPEWLLEHLDLNLGTFCQQVISTAEGEILKQRQHAMQAFVYSRVCEECNNGWMSDLENEAKTLLVPLIEGERTAFKLTGAEKLLFAIWSCKTAYILSRAALQNNPVGEDHLRYLATRSAMPAGVGVFAGVHTPTGKASFFQKNSWPHAHLDPSFGIEIESRESYKVALQFRHLLTLVAFCPGEGVRYLVAAGVHLQIWPIEPVYPAYDGEFDMPRPYDSRVMLERFSTSLAAMHPPTKTRLIRVPRI